MNLAERITVVKERLEQKKTRYETLEEILRENNKQKEELQKKHEDLVALVGQDTQASEVVKVLFDKISRTGFKFLEDLVNQALSSVFVDEDYEFKIQVDSRGTERTVAFKLRKGEQEFVPVNEVGGGIRVLISFILRVYYIIKTKSRHIIFMDEAFSNLSAEYVEPLVSFVRVLSKKFGFKFLFITHSPFIQTSEVDEAILIAKGRQRNRKK